MTGVEFSDFLRFLIQASFAVAGAASLWSVALIQRAKHAPTEAQQSYRELMHLVFKLFTVGIALFLIFWWIAALFVFSPQGMAHEGIRVDHTAEEIIRDTSRTSLLSR